jgi:hypothetical protein
MIRVSEQELSYIIGESLRLMQRGEFSNDKYLTVLNETVSMWIDPDTDSRIDDRADTVNMPPGSLAAVYRKGLADWIEHNRYGKGKEQHNYALNDVESFIHNRHDMRSQFPVEWNRVKKYRLKQKQKEYRKELAKKRKAYEREEKRKQKAREEAREAD